MRKILVISSVFLLVACSAVEDCFKRSGDQITREVEVGGFRKITVGERISLVLKQGDETSVTVKAGANFIDEVDVKVSGDMLKLTDNSGCNMTRDYDLITVYVTAPDVEEIYSNTGRPISSDGVLRYPILRLFAMDFFGGVGTGNFNIEIDNAQLVVESNYVAGFYISGHTDQLLLNFYDGNGRFEGDDLLAESIELFQRGSNDMIVRPVQNLSGNIYGTGNVISKTVPPVVNVQRHYTGRLIFED